jgi:acyl-CoA hydrolase
MGEINVMLARTSAPDENGYMSFGSAIWISRTAADIAVRIICGIDERLIRTYGENYLHVSEVDFLCEAATPSPRVVSVPARSVENTTAAEVIYTLIPADLIRDGDTLQMGLGDVTTAMALYLDDKHDLGIQTELIPGGVIDLVKKGVVTGRRKEVAPGKVVGSAFVALPDDELRYAHMNPMFELWDFCHTDDMRLLVQEEAFVAINNALQIDITGQVTSETLNGEIYSGPGGQTTFAVAASVCGGGRSIIALPSSSIVDGVRHSRVLPQLPPGSVVTTPRSFVDYVVTEHGIATLRGKDAARACRRTHRRCPSGLSSRASGGCEAHASPVAGDCAVGLTDSVLTTCPGPSRPGNNSNLRRPRRGSILSLSSWRRCMPPPSFASALNGCGRSTTTASHSLQPCTQTVT